MYKWNQGFLGSLFVEYQIIKVSYVQQIASCLYDSKLDGVSVYGEGDRGGRDQR